MFPDSMGLSCPRKKHFKKKNGRPANAAAARPATMVFVEQMQCSRIPSLTGAAAVHRDRENVRRVAAS
jgi:hypothetical protein